MPNVFYLIGYNLQISSIKLISPQVISHKKVPSTITNSADQVIPVVAVGSSAFYNYTDVTSITLPESVKTMATMHSLNVFMKPKTNMNNKIVPIDKVLIINRY